MGIGIAPLREALAGDNNAGKTLDKDQNLEIELLGTLKIFYIFCNSKFCQYLDLLVF